MEQIRIIRQIVVVFLFLCGFAGTGSTQEEGLSVRNSSPRNRVLSITVNGSERHYVVHVPKGYDPKRHWPAVIMFHGGGGTAKAVMWDTGWTEKADKEGFLAVFPDGTARDPSRPANFRANPQTWNDGSKRLNVGAAKRNIADVKFVSAMLDDLKARFSVDKLRVYATGFSNGASMTFRVARELSSVIAAAAPVAGVDWLEDKKPDRPVPLMYITGTADPLNPIDGGRIRIGLKSFGEKPATREMIGRWAKIHGCPKEPRLVHNKDGAKGIAYGRAGDAASVVFYTLDGHGHHWPGGRITLPENWAGKNVTRLKATDVIWRFFESRSVPAKSGHFTQRDAPADADKPRR